MSSSRHLLLGLMVALAVALLPMPYGYYQVLRWVCCIGFLFLGLPAEGNRKLIWFVLAGVYNPIVPVHAGRELWMVINLVTAGWLFLAYRKSEGDTNV